MLLRSPHLQCNDWHRINILSIKAGSEISKNCLVARLPAIGYYSRVYERGWDLCLFCSNHTPYLHVYICYILFQGSKLRDREEKEKNSPPPNNLVGMLAHSKGGLHENFVFMQPSVCMIVDLVPLHMCAMS